ncbi:MAG: signal peptidase I [Deltaproteobacteria bacterium]|nr:signal peptidase I [Deltaproteobacteria bacterium]
MESDLPAKLEIPKKKSKWREYTESLLVALLIAFFIRSFGVEAFKIPSGSMIPTLLVGDHLFVNKFVYGLRVPFTKKKLVHFKSPERGEAIVFIYPIDESKDFIKRVVGLPGDQIRMDGENVFVNGQELERQAISIKPGQNPHTSLLQVVPDATASESGIETIPYHPGWDDYNYYLENNGSHHYLVQYEASPSYDDRTLTVPPNHLFVMGDNRDNSSDSREWGFVPIENVKGKAMFIWLSLDFEAGRLRWQRFGKWIR